MSTIPVHARIPASGSGAWCASRHDGARLHAGVDLLGAIGTEVRAPEGGSVVVVGAANVPSDPVHRSNPPGWGGYGPELVVLHGDSGAFHLLAHLEGPAVHVGQRVTEGELVGRIGRTSTPHCHWEVRSRLQPPGTAAVVEVCADPAAWLLGEWRGYDGRCPLVPQNSRLTPRQCRPAWVGPAPSPFPRPVPRPVEAPLAFRDPRAPFGPSRGAHG